LKELFKPETPVHHSFGDGGFVTPKLKAEADET
jgi:hypothetical protein